jgi:hypothetical protein
MADFNIRASASGAAGAGLPRALDGKAQPANTAATHPGDSAGYRKPGSPSPVEASLLLAERKEQHMAAEMFVARKLLDVNVKAMPNPASVQIRPRTQAGAIAVQTGPAQLDGAELVYLKPGVSPPLVNLPEIFGKHIDNAQRMVRSAL